ncbi:hypothetical protein KTD15_07305 [Burkholderia multivorans]|uniref:hypothetical protein n=1 Tax=Burkholderia multivorans TaxID=87883 RepID=UPI001561AE74|nr:hypothetical protein [Burkholderia multivorans]MBU9118596.1 hypothetical protein [Burkholderia multivorans]
MTQIGFVIATIMEFLYGGLSNSTVACFLIASIATLSSRFLYRGRAKPDDS